MLPRQCIWRDNVIWWPLVRPKRSDPQKRLGAIIIKILNKKGVKIKEIPNQVATKFLSHNYI